MVVDLKLALLQVPRSGKFPHVPLGQGRGAASGLPAHLQAGQHQAAEEEDHENRADQQRGSE